MKKFQSTLSVRRATGLHVLIVEAETISIHALRKESDVVGVRVVVLDGISIHALRKESDIARSLAISLLRLFQSTLSVRRATRHRQRHRLDTGISIHALRKESDARGSWARPWAGNFNPRSP